MVYLDEFNSYYNFTSDYGPLGFRCSAGEIVGDTVYLYEGLTTLTLRKSGDSWLFHSHVFDTERAARAALAEGVLNMFDTAGKMDISLYTSDSEIHEAVTVTDRSIAERISELIANYNYEASEAPLTKAFVEVSDYRVNIVTPLDKMVFWAGDAEILQYSLRGRHNYYSVSSAKGTSLCEAVLQIYDELADN